MESSWQPVSIGDLGRVVTGRTPPGARQNYFGDFIPFLTPTDMDGRRKVDATARSLSPEGAKLLHKVMVPRGVAVSCIGWQMGKAILIDRPTATNQQINTIIPDTSRIHDLFFYYALTAKRHEIFALGAGGSRTPILNKTDFEKVMISVPSLSEQHAIAHILGTLDDKIELNRRMNETLEAMARALFKSWFVDFDPVRAKVEGRQPYGMDDETAALFPDSFEDSALGEIPKGWRVGVVEDLMILQRGFDLPKKERSFGPYPVLAASGPSGTHEEFKVEGPGVTTGRSGVLGKVYFVHENFWPLNTSLWVKKFNASRPLHAYHFLSTLNLGVFNAGSAVPTLNRNHVHNLPALTPDTRVIEAFEKLAMPMFSYHRANSRQTETLAALRDTLLPKLLSGEVCVTEAEDIVEDTD